MMRTGWREARTGHIEPARCGTHAVTRCYHLVMASTRTTFTLEDELAERARVLDVNISAAARAGVAAAVRAAQAERDRAAYLQHPEPAESGWAAAEAWGDE